MYLLLIVLLNVHQLCFARQHEPSCSQFEFQEKLLEKTVRYEHKLDVFKEKFEEWETRISKDLNDLKAIKHELGQKLGDIDNTLEEKKKEFDVAMAEGLKKQEITLNSIKENALTPAVVVLVNDVSDQDVDTGKVIKFTSVVTNEGGAYDIGTGKFTAPYNGSYIFSTSVCAHISKWVAVTLMAADREIGTTSIYNSATSATCSGVSGMTILSKGDQVWVQGSYKATTALCSRHYSIPSSPMFSGMLVHSGTA